MSIVLRFVLWLILRELLDDFQIEYDRLLILLKAFQSRMSGCHYVEHSLILLFESHLDTDVQSYLALRKASDRTLSYMVVQMKILRTPSR